MKRNHSKIRSQISVLTMVFFFHPFWAFAQSMGDLPIINQASKRIPIDQDLVRWENATARYGLLLERKNEKMEGDLSIRMKRDSILWFSVSAVMGIQILKGVMVNDTLKVLDLFNKNYYELPKSTIANMLGVPFGLHEFQQLFLGQSFIDSADSFRQNLSEKLYLRKIDRFTMQSTVGQPKTPKGNMLMHILQSLIVSETHPSSITINNSDWADFAPPSQIPYTIDLVIKSEQENAHLTMSLKTLHGEAIPSYPFSVGRNYNKVNIDQH
ncbi:MAG: DUF4292 domain-containing protein [Bacteroidetes bacterium]|nr:DUF4292 domain-containing protein [Bacteroidota bacterium]